MRSFELVADIVRPESGQTNKDVISEFITIISMMWGRKIRVTIEDITDEN